MVLEFIHRWYLIKDHPPPQGIELTWYSEKLGKSIHSNYYPELLKHYDWWAYKLASPSKVMGNIK